MAFSRLRREAEKEREKRGQQASRGQVAGAPVSPHSRLAQEAAKERGADADGFMQSRMIRSTIGRTTNTPESIRERAIELSMQMGTDKTPTANNAMTNITPTTRSVEELDRAYKEAEKREIEAKRNYVTQSREALRRGDKATVDALMKAMEDAAAARALVEKEIEQKRYYDKYSDKTYNDDFFGQFGANMAAGRLAQDTDAAYSDYAKDPTEANRVYAEAMNLLEQQFQANNAEALDDEGAVLPWITQSAAGYLPQFWDQTKATLSGAAGGGITGAGVGSVIPGLGTATGAVWGARAGAVAGSGAYSYNQMRGAAFQELLAAGLDEETAQAAANDEAVISALIEMADTGVDIATLGTGKLLSLLGKGGAKAAAKGAAKEAAESATKRFLKGLAGYGLNIAGEAVEEGLQQSVSIANQNRDGTGIWNLTGGAVSTLWDAARGENDEARTEILEAAGEGAKIAAMFGGATRAATGIANTALEARTGRNMQGMGEDVVQAMIETGLESDVNTESHQLATRLKAKLDSGKTLSSLEVGRLQQANIRAIEAEQATRNATDRVQTEEETAGETGIQQDGETYTLEQLAHEAVAEREKAAVSAPVTLEELASETVAERERTSQGQAGQAETTAQTTPIAENIETRETKIEQPAIDTRDYGDLGIKAFEHYVTNAENSEQAARQFDSAYKLGAMETPRDKVSLENKLQETAYEAGRLDAIAKKPQTEQKAVENTAAQGYTGGEQTTQTAAKPKKITTKKSDWAAHDVQWAIPGRKTPIAYSTTATSDTIGVLADENPTATISELQGLVNYDPEAKKVLQQYIDAGYGDHVANEWFSYDKSHGYTRNTTDSGAAVNAKEDVNNGEATVGEVSDEGRVLESDVSGQSDGGLLDELAPEDVQEDARGRDAVPASEADGRESSGVAGGDDSRRTGGRRSVGSHQGTDLQPAAGEVNEFDTDGTPIFAKTREEANIEAADKREMKERRQAAAEKYGLTEKEGATLENYTEWLFKRLNKELFTDTLREEHQPMVDRLVSALKKFPTFEGTTYRNLKFENEADYNKFLADHAEGQTVPITAFASTSKRPNGYPKFGEYVVHMVIDGKTGADIADTYGIPRQQEVILLPGTEIKVTKVAKANDGKPLIYVQEVANSDLGRNHEDQKPARSDESNRSESGAGKSVSGGDGRDGGEVRGVAQHRHIRDGVLPERGESDPVKDDTAAEVEQKTELATQESARGNNFSIPEDGLKLPKGDKARFKANVEAIKTLRKIMAENRRATPAEQEILSKYVGWGGLANAFDEKKTEWAKEYKQLKELLTEKEYSSARGSTLNAHYTDVGVIRAIYNGLAGLGFKGGRLLEPSAGIGHFAGAMPAELAGSGTSWTMIELDELTGNIAKHLYPNADVRVQGFEAAKIPDNYMDAAISNVPFGNYAIVDKAYPKTVTSAIHNYFFAKALDKVRPGGIVTFITSRYTMDSQDSAVRRYIAQRADLLGAIRLPDSAFKSNANTEVVTDILILKKREAGTPYGGETFESTDWHHTALNIYEKTNDYFAEHPEMVLGTPSSTGGMYRGNALTYTAKPGNLSKQIEKAFASIKGKMDYPVQRTQEEIRREIKEAAGKGKNGAIIRKDGKLYRNRDGVLEIAEDIGKANEEAVSAIVELRDTARQLLDAQLDGGSEAQISTLRKTLNKQYDAFVKKYGILNSQKNKRLVNMDVDAPFILALENFNKESKKATKADIFTKNTITPVKTVTHVNTVEEGLIVSMNETGGVDVERIASLLGEGEETVTRALLDNRLAFKNRDGKLETAEKYLAGNVKAKLRDAEALAEGDSDYNANVEELRKIIPADIAAEDISVQPGATWIPDSVYSDFVAETLGSKNSEWRKHASVTYNKLLGQFTVTIHEAWLKNRVENTSTWGTPDRSFVNIFEATLNSKSVTVTRKTEDGSRYVDRQATAAAQEKQEKIRAEFQRWIWDDDTRKETLARLYNDTFNNYVTPQYDGSNLTVNGSNAEKPLRPHQKNAVQRIINSGGNTLLAHKVGAGKTYEMAAAAMKMRQLGIVKKPMFVVPKSLVSQWGREFLDFFPAAKILVLGEKDFSASNRKLFANRIATGDYDAVILSQEQLKAVPMSVENQEAFYQDQITALELTMAETARNNGKRDPSIKQMERSKKSFEAKLKKLGDMKKDEDNIDFEQLGVDALFVDEAHSYKNLFYSTNMNNVSGLGNKDGSQKAFDLYMKVRHLQSVNGGRGIVFATATPVMNSMSEMYIMQKYLQGDLLEARGLHSFDAWASQFGEVRTVLEMNPSGKGFRQKQSFSRFKNLAELQQMFRAFADVLTDIPGLKIPTMKAGKRIIVESDPSEFQLDFIEKLAERADAIKNRKVDPKDDNMLKVTSEGRKLSYTQRMIDPALPYEDGNKIMKCADNVVSIWKESKSTKGTQLIFCDLSTPKGGANTETNVETDVDIEDISIYDDIRNTLIGAGIPAKEIAFIHDANTNEKKIRLFEDVNEGKVRVLIGSTGKMGVGMNAQKRIVALHHLDAPWRPGDIEQREGRALRQGNMNEEVGMYVYVTKQTFDSRMWDNLQRKASFIHQVMAGDLTARESDGDGDFALSAAEIKAISSGNPLIMEQFEVAAELSKLENLERAHAKEVSDAKKRIEKAKLEIVSDELLIERLRSDITAREDTSGDKFKVKVGGKTYTERKAAGDALIAEAKKRLKIARDAETTEEIGTFAGFKLLATNSGELLLKGKGQYRSTVNMESPVGTVTRLEEAAKRLDKLLEASLTRLNENKQSITKLEKTVASKFDKAGELVELRKRNAEILAELNPEDEKNIAELGDSEDSTDDMVDLSKKRSTEGVWSAARAGEGKTPMRLPEIIEKIRHDFGINITTGHIRSAGVLGRYNQQNHGIRTRIANHLPTVAHELGHHLDTTYSLTDEANLTEELKNELLDNLDQEMKDNYTEDKWVREGMAEFLRNYLENHETAAIDYPEFTKYFINSLSTSDAVLITQLADEVNAYYALDADTATSSIRLGEEGNPDARTWGEKIKEKANALYQAWVDANHGIKLFDEATGSNAYTMANNAAYSDAMAGQIIVSDLTDANGQYVAAGLKTALNGVNLKDKTEYRLFGEYLTVKHGPERLREGMRIFADDRKNNSAFMNRRAEELEAKYPQFKEAAERLYEFQSKFLQTWGVETGLVAKESADKWAKRWQYYVPLNRAVSEDKRRIGAKRGFANQNSTIKKAIGSGLDIVHPVDNIVTNIVKMVNAGVRNNVMRVITDSAGAMGADATFMELVPTPLVRRSFSMSGVKNKLHDGIDEALASGEITNEGWDVVDTMIEDIDEILYQYGKGKAHGDVITVLKDGKQEFWKINDPLLLKSITTMSPKKMEGILDAYAVVSRFMTANITGYNVVWSLFSNFPRDLMTLFTYSKTRNPLKVFGAMGSAYMNKISDSFGKGLDPLYREYVALGGGSISAYTADRDLAKRARKQLAGKNFTANPLDWVGYTSDVIEMGPRYATYKLLREKGVDPQEAFAGAMDITVNFRRGGSISRELNKVVPFFNVSVQGLDKFRRWISAEDAGKVERKKVVRSRVLGFVAASASLAVLTYALNNGDEEDEENYEQLSNYQKNSYWNIPLGDGKYFAIPKPRELGVLSSLMETAMEYFIGENNHAFDEFYAYASSNLLPKIASDLAQVGDKGVVETGMSLVGNLGMVGVLGYMGANRDFLGKPIVAAGLQVLEPKDQYTNRTSKIAYWVGQAFNASPQMVDYFFQQTLGGFWKWQKALFPVGGENRDWTLGVQNTYVKDNQYTTDIVNWMYDQADKSSKKANSDRSNMDKAITAKMDANMTSFYSKFYAISKNEKETNSIRGARQTVLNMLLEYRKATDSGYVTDAQEAVYAIVRREGSTEYLPGVMQTVVKDGNDKEHHLSPSQYVEYQTDYLRLYWEYVEDNMLGAKSYDEKLAVLEAAKNVARQNATSRTLGRIGATATDFSKKYEGVSANDVIDFMAGVTLAGKEDDKVSQSEVVDIITDMALSDDNAWTLYFSRYDGKAAHEAQQYGISAELYMKAKLELEQIKPDYYRNGREVEGSKRRKVERYLRSVCDNYKEYLFLLGTVYSSVKDDRDYKIYFGE